VSNKVSKFTHNQRCFAATTRLAVQHTDSFNVQRKAQQHRLGECEPRIKTLENEKSNLQPKLSFHRAREIPLISFPRIAEFCSWILAFLWDSRDNPRQSEWEQQSKSRPGAEDVLVKYSFVRMKLPRTTQLCFGFPGAFLYLTGWCARRVYVELPTNSCHWCL
jgi:hypothetical protein